MLRLIDPFVAGNRRVRQSSLCKPRGGDKMGNTPGTTLSSLTVTGSTTLMGNTALSGNVTLNRPIYFTSGQMMVDPANRAIYLSSIKSSTSSLGSVLTQKEITTTASANAVATSSFTSIATATTVSSTTTATSAVSMNTTASQFSRTTKATGRYTDRVIIGAATYTATPVTIKDASGRTRTVLAYVKTN